MYRKRKTDILKVCISAVLATAFVLLIWMLKNPRFQDISLTLFAFAVIAFFAEILLLTVLKGKNPIKRAIKIILLFIINITVFSSAVIISFAPAVILQPHSDDVSYESLKKANEADEITFEGKNGSINGWFYNVAGESAPTVLYFYGNYETASSGLFNLIENYDVSAFSGCNFAVFDYPAYGKSEGKCTDDSILAFSLDVYDELIKITDNIIVLGYSVGTGPACYLASERDVDSLILYAPYADGTNLYNNVIDIFHGPMKKLVTFNIDTVANAASVRCPVLILASDEDELIPYESSLRLRDKFGGMCTFIKIPEITHNQFFASSLVKDETAKFIEEVMAK